MSRNRFTTLLSTVKGWAHITTRTTQSEVRCTQDPPRGLPHTAFLTLSRRTSNDTPTGALTPTGPSTLTGLLTPTSYHTLTPIDTITDVPTLTGQPIDISSSSSDQPQGFRPASIRDSDSVGIFLLFLRDFHGEQYHSDFQTKFSIVTV